MHLIRYYLYKEKNIKLGNYRGQAVYLNQLLPPTPKIVKHCLLVVLVMGMVPRMILNGIVFIF